MTDREILLDIQQKLEKICSYIDKIESDEHKQEDYNMQFLLNVAADMYVESLEKLKENNYGNTSN